MPVVSGNSSVVASRRPTDAPVLVAFKAASNDPQLHVKAAAGHTFNISGSALNSGIKQSVLSLEVGGKKVSVPLDRGMDPGRALQAIEAQLPPGYATYCTKNLHRAGADVTFGITKIKKPVAEPTTPKVTAKCSDPAQKIKSSGDNQFIISGTATNSGKIRSAVELKIDGKKVSVPLSRSDSPQDTAAKIKRALPAGYSADVRVLMAPFVPVEITITRK